MDGGRLGDGGCCAGFLFIKSTSLSYKGVDPRNCLNKTLGVGDVFGNGVGSFRFNFFSIVRLPGLCLRRGISKLYHTNTVTNNLKQRLIYGQLNTRIIIIKQKRCVCISMESTFGGASSHVCVCFCKCHLAAIVIVIINFSAVKWYQLSTW